MCEHFTTVCEHNESNNKKKAYKKEKLVGYIELVNIAHKLFICLNTRIINIRITNNTYKLNFINL